MWILSFKNWKVNTLPSKIYKLSKTDTYLSLILREQEGEKPKYIAPTKKAQWNATTMTLWWFKKYLSNYVYKLDSIRMLHTFVLLDRFMNILDYMHSNKNIYGCIWSWNETWLGYKHLNKIHCFMILWIAGLENWSETNQESGKDMCNLKEICIWEVLGEFWLDK